MCFICKMNNINKKYIHKQIWYNLQYIEKYEYVTWIEQESVASLNVIISSFFSSSTSWEVYPDEISSPPRTEPPFRIYKIKKISGEINISMMFSRTSSNCCRTRSSNCRSCSIVIPCHWSIEQKSSRWKLVKILVYDWKFSKLNYVENVNSRETNLIHTALQKIPPECIFALYPGQFVCAHHRFTSFLPIVLERPSTRLSWMEHCWIYALHLLKLKNISLIINLINFLKKKPTLLFNWLLSAISMLTISLLSSSSSPKFSAWK